MPEPGGDPEFTFSGAAEDYPEDWQEEGPSGIRLRSNRRRSAAQSLHVNIDGAVGPTGRKMLFLPGKFRFCPACLHQPAGQAREMTKLASLSAEGRSSATTLLVSSTLRWMNADENHVPGDKRKLLGFTDNRQDAALQAGHFNDFLFVSGTTLMAAEATGRRGALVELDPAYCDVILRRFEEATGTAPALEDGGSYAEVAAKRARPEED